MAVITKITCYFRLDTVLRNPHHSLSAVGIVRLIGTGGSCSTTSSSRSSSRCRPCNPMFGCLTSCPCRRRRCQCRSRSFCTYLNGAARVIGLCVTSGIWFCITACLLCESFPVDRSSRCHGSLMAIAWYRYSIESYFFFFFFFGKNAHIQGWAHQARELLLWPCLSHVPDPPVDPQGLRRTWPAVRAARPP